MLSILEKCTIMFCQVSCVTESLHVAVDNFPSFLAKYCVRGQMIDCIRVTSLRAPMTKSDSRDGRKTA